MLKARNVNATPRRLILPALATVGLIGIIVKSRSSSSEDIHPNTARARAKRDNDALGGAGIGGNMQSGGHEKGAVAGSNGAAETKVQTTAESRDQLPSGGVGGGPGAGQSNARAIEMRPSGNQEGVKDKIMDSAASAGDMVKNATRTDEGTQEASLQSRSGTSQTPGVSKQDSDSHPARNSTTKSQASTGPYPGSSGTSQSVGQRLQGAFHQGGSTAGERGENLRKFHDPKVHSNLTDTPTRRGQMRSNS